MIGVSISIAASEGAKPVAQSGRGRDEGVAAGDGKKLGFGVRITLHLCARPTARRVGVNGGRPMPARMSKRAFVFYPESESVIRKTQETCARRLRCARRML
jgi:hypothetical protein